MKRSIDKSACYIELRLAKQWMATYLRKWTRGIATLNCFYEGESCKTMDGRVS